MKPNVEELKKVLCKIDDERYKLSRIIRNLEDVPKLKALVGKYFKYRNSFNSKEQWWLYIHITGYKNYNLIVDKFEKNSRSIIEISFSKDEYGVGFTNPPYVEITEKEYKKAFKNILRTLNKKIV